MAEQTTGDFAQISAAEAATGGVLAFGLRGKLATVEEGQDSDVVIAISRLKDGTLRGRCSVQVTEQGFPVAIYAAFTHINDPRLKNKTPRGTVTQAAGGYGIEGYCRKTDSRGQWKYYPASCQVREADGAWTLDATESSPFHESFPDAALADVTVFGLEDAPVNL